MESTTTERRLIGHMVVRNERYRYLTVTAGKLKDVCDETIIVDDNSTDGTFDYLLESGFRVVQRGGASPSFAEDESGFRGMAWHHMELASAPRETDWILCLDADEILGTHDPDIDVRNALDQIIDRAESEHIDAVCLPVDEIFAVRDDGLYRRTDGYWGAIQACRLVRWQPDGTFEARREGGGSVPTNWIDWRFVAEDLRILHFGYTRWADRLVRYQRYRDGKGHNPTHVASIVTHPQLARWPGAAAWVPA